MGGKNMDIRPVLPVRLILYRFFTGQHLDGYRRTNGTFLYRGTRPLGGIVKASNWAYRPGYQRLLIRFGWLFGLTFFPVGFLFWPWTTKVVMWTLFGALVLWYGYKLVRRIVRFLHVRRWTKPLHDALSGQVGIRRDIDPEKWITLPMNFRTDPDVQIRLDLPDEFNGSDAQSVKAVTGTIQAKLGMPDAEVYLRLQGNTPHMIVVRAPAPPDRVMYSDVEAVIENASDAAPFLGYGPRNKPVTVKFDDESPHVLVSAGSGAGKSVILRLITAQGLSKGGEAVICDVKRVSHSWAKGLPRVTYVRSIDDIHDALVALDAECERRYQLIDDDENADVGPRITIDLEEMNATIRKLESYWRRIRTNDQPKVSPAVEAIGNLLFMGRAAKMHVIAVAQMATARALGGPEARENFATRILARYTINAWKMLVPEIWPAPKSSRHSGRVQVAIAGEATETQIAFLTNEEARALALKGGGELSVKPTLHAVSEEHAAPIEDRKTLGQAIKAEWLPMDYEAAKKARSRDPDFPQGVTGIGDGYNRYTREELEYWFRNRERGKKGDSA